MSLIKLYYATKSRFFRVARTPARASARTPAHLRKLPHTPLTVSFVITHSRLRLPPRVVIVNFLPYPLYSYSNFHKRKSPRMGGDTLASLV